MASSTFTSPSSPVSSSVSTLSSVPSPSYIPQSGHSLFETKLETKATDSKRSADFIATIRAACQYHTNSTENLVTTQEFNLTFYELQALLASYATTPSSESQLAHDLEQFLAKRWERVKLSDLSYTSYTNSRANQLCLSLATHLNPARKNALLMPTVTAVDPVSQDSLESYRLDQLFILDDGIHFQTYEALTYLAYARMQERENTLLIVYDPKETKANNQRPISPNELECFYQHQPKARSYYNLLSQVKQYGSKLYIELLALRDGLRAGNYLNNGSRGENHELTGPSATAAIASFFEFFRSLPETEQKRIEGFSNSNDVSFQTVFTDLGHNLTEVPSSGKGSLPCIVLTETAMRRIIEQNETALLGTSALKLENLINDISHHKKTICNDFKTPHAHHFTVYGEARSQERLSDSTNIHKNKKPYQNYTLLVNIIAFLTKEVVRLGRKNLDQNDKRNAYQVLINHIRHELSHSFSRSTIDQETVLKEVIFRLDLLSSHKRRFSTPDSQTNWKNFKLAHQLIPHSSAPQISYLAYKKGHLNPLNPTLFNSRKQAFKNTDKETTDIMGLGSYFMRAF